MMRSEISSPITSNSTTLLRLVSHNSDTAKSPPLNFGFKRQQAPKSSSVRASDDRSHPPARTVGSPEPPWLVLPPSPPENPFSSQSCLSDLQMKGIGGNGIPFSMRLVQMKKRLATAPGWTECLTPAVEDPTWKAVSALVFMIGELQRSVLSPGGGGVEEVVLDRVSRDRRDSFVWLFRRVFFSSPNLVVSLLVLLANFVAFSAEKNAAAISDAEESEILAVATSSQEGEEDLNSGAVMESAVETIGIGGYKNWFDVGIKEGSPKEPGQHEDEASKDRKRRAYERTIAEGEVNSLIISNYAQFLYRVANDHDRAEQYFQWAVMAEPRDAEAMSRYAFFLWEERGDISGAEEMFLEAIDAEPGNHHHSSNYAWFLWKTGAVDTCYPLDPPSSSSST